MSEREQPFQLIEDTSREEGPNRRAFYLSMGPSHPAMHGIIRINLELAIVQRQEGVIADTFANLYLRRWF